MSSFRRTNPAPLIVPSVIATKGSDWNEETHKVVESDAQRLLEALLADAGVEGAVAALNRQGFRGESYRYLLVTLHAEALDRRANARSRPESAVNEDCT